MGWHVTDSSLPVACGPPDPLEPLHNVLVLKPSANTEGLLFL